MKPELATGWKHGPLPPNTWYWGAVVLYPEDRPITEEDYEQGFRFAGFSGDHVVTIDGDKKTRHEAHEVAAYNNCLILPLKKDEGK